MGDQNTTLPYAIEGSHLDRALPERPGTGLLDESRHVGHVAGDERIRLDRRRERPVENRLEAGRLEEGRPQPRGGPTSAVNRSATDPLPSNPARSSQSDPAGSSSSYMRGQQVGW
jgi:hypothetical protein